MRARLGKPLKGVHDRAPLTAAREMDPTNTRFQPFLASLRTWSAMRLSSETVGLPPVMSCAIMALIAKGHQMKITNITTKVRQHHALEHATIHVLSRYNPNVRIMGRSTVSGFHIVGALSTQDVANAATEALARLQQGEAHLSIHPRCGTNLAVTGVLAGAAAFGATMGRPRSKLERLPLALTAATLAAVAAQPIAHVVQERITTSADVEGLFIAEVERQQRGRWAIHRVVVGRE